MPNKATREFRETVNELLRAFADRIPVWFDSVASGDAACGRPPDPARALVLLAKLAEFAVPKLAASSTAQVVRWLATAIEVEFVNVSSAPTYLHDEVH